MIQKQLQQELTAVIEQLFGEKVSVKVDRPTEPSYGDYSTNIALLLSKQLKKFPVEVAEHLKQTLKTKNLTFLENIEVIKPGFINFFVSQEALVETLQVVVQQKDEFGKGDMFEGKKIMTEFTDPNPFKQLHIGHIYSNTVGEVLSRLFESQKATVRRVCYQGDVGLHVAKALWGMRKEIGERQLTIEEVDRRSLEERTRFLGDSYALGSVAYEENESAKQEIILLNKQIFELIEKREVDEKDSEIWNLYAKGKQWSLEYFDMMYKRLGCAYTQLYFESEAGPIGLALVKEYLAKGLFEESNGAVIFPGERYGLHNRVFINSLGLPTYEAKELGLASSKYKDFKYDASVIITGNEINDYFKVVLKALSLIHPDLASKTHHISHGMVRLPDGKMSSRKGNVITAQWLLDEVRDTIQGTYSSMTEDVAEKVSIASIKYAFLKSSIGKDIEFNLEESISLDGNSGPYLQYTYARSRSILEKAKGTHADGQTVKIDNTKSLKFEKEEYTLLRLLIHFPEIVEKAAISYSPSTVCTYLFELAQSFNLFYQHHTIVGSDTEKFRLVLTQSVGQILKNGLYLLGIDTVERM